MPITITPITLDRVPAYHRVLDSVARERKYLSMLEAPPRDKSIAYVERMLVQDNVFFLALDDDQVVGWCDIDRHERPSRHHAGNLGMGLLADYRGEGLGKRLLEKAIAGAWQRGLTRVELTVYRSNPKAINLYTRLGFREEGTMQEAAKIDGVYLDMIFMALLKNQT